MDERIELLKGDITKLEIEAVVNAANRQLKGGGGVDGAIHKAAGPVLHEECMRIIQKMGECPTGEACITSAGNMPSKYVIHTVGPIWRGGNMHEQKLLAKAYRSTLELAVDFGIKEIAFPNISTGVYSFPKELAAETALDETNKFLMDNPDFKRVVFVCHEDDNYEIYKKLMES